MTYLFTVPPEDHLQRIQQVFETLRANQCYLKESKCIFAQPSLEYLGHIISDAGVAIDPDKTKDMIHWPTPTNMTKLRAFLGLTGYYRKFVKNYGIIAKPLTNVLRLKQFQWTAQAQEAFDNLKIAMTQTQYSHYPTSNFHFKFKLMSVEKALGQC